MAGFTENPTTRFSNKVESYVKYRPDYPDNVTSILQEKYGLNDKSVIADIGSGTGIFSKHFLKYGLKVYGVEPNKEMREAGECFLAEYSNFSSVDGTAENTKLADSSIDFITAAQAFHWFHPQNTKREFSRILKSTGRVVLIWNDRRTESDEFHTGYNEFIKKYSKDYLKVTYKEPQDHLNEDAVIDNFLGKGKYSVEYFDNCQEFDFEGLLGRLCSSSYMPNEGDEGYDEVKKALNDFFEQYQKNGSVRISYETKMYVSGPWNEA